MGKYFMDGRKEEDRGPLNYEYDFPLTAKTIKHGGGVSIMT